MSIEPRPRSLRRTYSRDLHSQASPAAVSFAHPVVCPACGAAYRGGFWRWAEPAPDSSRLKCPACRRIEANIPAGEVLLSGEFLAQHRAEVIALARAHAARIGHDHPMQRIIEVIEGATAVAITTTDGRLARGIGIALQETCKGDLDVVLEKNANFVRVAWHR
ncbi:MAG TPA: BCAM0308 family protein [Usitatibacter sp.]|nr:BCAM0308 family protein [Usitatibacter sp.]